MSSGVQTPEVGEQTTVRSPARVDAAIVVPVYNEAETIDRVVGEIVATLEAGDSSFEVLVLNDGSTDWSPDLERRLREHPQVRLVSFQENQGKGAVLDRAFPMLESRVTVVIDADGEYLATEIPAVLDPLLNGEADWASGARYGFGRDRPRQYLLTYLVNRAVNRWFHLWSGIRFRDILSGLYGFRTELVRGVRLREKRFSYTPELIWKLSRGANLRILEVPISYRFRSYAQGKKIRWWETATILRAILRYRKAR